jgi:hypothetical protein
MIRPTRYYTIGYEPLFDSARQVWKCAHCGEERVWGFGEPPPEAAIGEATWLKCQQSGQHHPHKFIGTQDRWVGKECPLTIDHYRLFTLTRRRYGLEPLKGDEA